MLPDHFYKVTITNDSLYGYADVLNFLVCFCWSSICI